MKKNIKNINFTNYANINGDIVKCDIMKKYEEDSTVFVKAYYSEYHFEYKYVMQDGILTREEGELLLSKIDRHHGIYVRALNVGPDDFLKEMTTTLSFTLNKFAILLLLKVRLLVLWLRYRTRRAQI